MNDDVKRRVMAVVGGVGLLLLISGAGPAQTESKMDDSKQLPDLTGTWEATVETTSASRLPVVGEVRSTQRSSLEVEISQREDRLRLRVRVCDIEIESGTRLVSTDIPEAFVESIGVRERPGRIEATDQGFRIVVGGGWTTQGVRLDKPESQPLPDDPDDPRIFDQDGDGNPGLTVRVDGVVSGEVYVAQKSRDRWIGIVDDDEIRGQIHWENEQSVIGASSRWLESQPDSEPVTDPKQNWIRMQKQTGERAQCS